MASTQVITVRGLQAGQICETQFVYLNTDPLDPPLSGYAVADKFADQVIPEWVPLVTADFQFIELSYWSSNNNGTGIYPLPATVGSYAGQAMPPFVTANFIKVVEPAVDQTGTDSKPIKRGRFGLSGIPEEIGQNGLITDGAWLVQAQTFGNALQILVDVDGLGTDTNLYVVRLAAGGWDVNLAKAAEVVAIQMSTYGTQNTRKR